MDKMQLMMTLSAKIVKSNGLKSKSENINQFSLITDVSRFKQKEISKINLKQYLPLDVADFFNILLVKNNVVMSMMENGDILIYCKICSKLQVCCNASKAGLCCPQHGFFVPAEEINDATTTTTIIMQLQKHSRDETHVNEEKEWIKFDAKNRAVTFQQFIDAYFIITEHATDLFFEPRAVPNAIADSRSNNNESRKRIQIIRKLSFDVFIFNFKNK